MTADSVNHLMDSNIGTSNAHIEEFVKQISAKVNKYVEDRDRGVKETLDRMKAETGENYKP
eukprot:8872989-Lingulodinium_polyedra.AAC.1